MTRLKDPRTPEQKARGDESFSKLFDDLKVNKGKAMAEARKNSPDPSSLPGFMPHYVDSPKVNNPFKHLQKQIEAAGKEEYALWRKTKDRVNSLIAGAKANAEAHIDRFETAIEAGMNGDHEGMLDMFGPGSGVVGKIKKIKGWSKGTPDNSNFSKEVKKAKDSKGKLQPKNKSKPNEKIINPKNIAPEPTESFKGLNKSGYRTKAKSGTFIAPNRSGAPLWSTGSKASKKSKWSK